jgi:signal peptidase I
MKRRETKIQTRKTRVWQNVKSVTSTLVFVWLFTHHVAQATMVPTESMNPTILVGDHFMLDKVAFPANYPDFLLKFLPERAIQRTDILAFWSPEVPDLRLIKRVIGLPGETLEIRVGDIYINGEKLKEPYVVHALPSERRLLQNVPPISIPTDSFFMMGDNRDDSRDSRYFGVVSHKAMIGRPMFIYWSYESGPYPQDGGVGQWAEYYASIATHFFTRTRWMRTGTVLR